MEYDIKKLVAAVAETLNFHLRLGEYLTYNELALIHGLPTVNSNWDGHILNKVLKELDREDAEKNRPFRSSCVVRKDTKRPGKGFDASLAVLKRIRVGTKADKEGAYQREFSQAVAYAKALNQTRLGGVR